jgi:hypothetical protein
MRSDLERLLITEAELQEITGFDRHRFQQSSKVRLKQTKLQWAIACGISAIAFITFASVFLPSLRFSGIFFLVSLTLGTLSIAIEFAEVAFLFLVVSLAAAVYSLYMLTTAPIGVILLCLALAIALGIAALFLSGWIISYRHNAKAYPLKKQIPEVILRLFAEVDKCNRAITDIDVVDQLQDAGNAIKLESRESAIAALRMTRNDLVRALKTERILRENPQFHPERFDVDITAFEALQMSDRAKEYARTFDTTLQIAIDVQSVMYDLQNH